MLVSSRASDAPPLKRPAALASFTTPSARAPLGMATLPSTSTGSWIVAENLSPELAVLELTVWSSTTAITVSAGTTRGFGSSAFFTALLADSAADGEELAVASEPLWAWFAVFWPWQPAIKKPRNREHAIIEPERRIIRTLRFFMVGQVGFLTHSSRKRRVRGQSSVTCLPACCGQASGRRSKKSKLTHDPIP